MFKQRRPFFGMLNGTPTVNANVLPDIIQNVKILSFTTNSYTRGIDLDAIFASRYGTLEQNLNTADAYGDRSVSLVQDSVINSESNGIIQGYRVPSTNQNGIGRRTLDNGNRLNR